MAVILVFVELFVIVVIIIVAAAKIKTIHTLCSGWEVHDFSNGLTTDQQELDYLHLHAQFFLLLLLVVLVIVIFVLPWPLPSNNGIIFNSLLLSSISSFIRLCTILSSLVDELQKEVPHPWYFEGHLNEEFHTVWIILLCESFPWYCCECTCKIYKSYRWLHTYMCYYVGQPLGPC